MKNRGGPSGLIHRAVLGLRLGVAGGWPSILRLFLMGLGPALGVVVLLGAISVRGAEVASDGKRAQIQGQVGSSIHTRNVTLSWQVQTTFASREVVINFLRPVGHAPTPPGLAALPAPGTAVVSPALAELLNGPGGSLLMPRLRGHPVGLIGEAGLLAPDELLAYVGAPDTANPQTPLAYRLTPGSASPQVSYYGRPPWRWGLVGVLLLVLLALLAPVLVLVSASARLSADAREARVATLRLIGASAREVRLILGSESGLVGFLGGILGTAGFFMLRPLLLAIPAIGRHWFATDLSPPGWTIPLVIGTMVALSTLVGGAGVRVVASDPLAKVRRGPPRKPRARWPIMLAAGLALLGVCALLSRILHHLTTPLPELIGAAVVLTFLGLVGTTSWLVANAARIAVTRARGPARLTAASRLASGTGYAVRAASAIAVFLGVILSVQGVLMLGVERHSVVPGTTHLAPSDVIVGEPGPQLSALKAVPGVRSVRSTGHGEGGPGTTCGNPAVCEVVAVVGTDGQPSTIERIRNTIGLQGKAWTPMEWQTYLSPHRSGEIPAIVRMLSLAMLMILLLTATSMLLATVEGIIDRRAAFAALSAFGAPVRVLWTSMLIELAVPTGVAVVLGSVVGIVVLVFLSGVLNASVSLPLAGMITDGIFITLTTALSFAISRLWIRGTVRPEYLGNDALGGA